jgi:hypothetical protein
VILKAHQFKTIAKNRVIMSIDMSLFYSTHGSIKHVAVGTFRRV